jgi:hypothetical protein
MTDIGKRSETIFRDRNAVRRAGKTAVSEYHVDGRIDVGHGGRCWIIEVK